MNNPIQQLVDAAHAFCRACCITRESDEAEQQAILEAYNKTRTALAAVESAQMETRWVIQFQVCADPDGWEDLVPPTESEVVIQKQWAEVKPERGHRLVRIDTYRTVESDQK